MRPAQIKLSVRSTILRLLFSLLAAYMACGGAAAQNVVTDLERHCGANQRGERQGAARRDSGEPGHHAPGHVRRREQH